jgi:hypothetical protein
MLTVLQQFLISGIQFPCARRILLVGAVVHERADLDAGSKLGGSAHVIAVIVSNDHVIELVETFSFRGREDTIGISPVESRPSRIDQHGLTARIHEQCRLAALHVNEIDVQGLRRLGCGRDGNECTQSQRHDKDDVTRIWQSHLSLAPWAIAP